MRIFIHLYFLKKLYLQKHIPGIYSKSKGDEYFCSP